MKHSLFAIPFLLLGCAMSSPDIPRSTPEEELVALVGLNVVDVETDKVIPNQTILVQDGLILSIAGRDHIKIPPTASVIDVEGRYVIPGLWDMHVHLTDESALGVYLAHGVVGVRDMAAGMYVEPDQVRKWIEEVAEGGRDGPRIFRAGFLFDGAPSGYAGTVVIEDPEGVQEAIRHAQSHGADFLKVLSRLSKETFWALSAEAKAQKLDLVGHVPTAVGVMASASAMRSMEHLMGVPLACSNEEERLRVAFGALRSETDPEQRARRTSQLRRRLLDTHDSAKAETLFATLQRHGVWQVPTLKGWDFDLRGLSGATVPAAAWSLVPEEQRVQWRESLEGRAGRNAKSQQLDAEQFLRYQEITKAMQSVGVGILAGTDTPHTLVVPGLGLHQELQLLVESGLSPAEAMATATIGAARFLELDHERGRIAPGYAADLLIVRDNPLTDIHNTLTIEYVVRDGYLYGRERLEVLLDEARKAYR